MTNKPQEPLTRQEECFLFSSLMLVTCFFLPWRDTRSPSDDLLAWNALAPAWVILFTILCLTPLTVRLPRVRPWAGLVAANSMSGVLLLAGGNEYGAHLARVFSLAMLVLSANPAFSKSVDIAMKKLNSQKAEVFTHWGTSLAGIEFSAQEFYTKLEAAIGARAWPGVELLRVLHTEAGLLSHKREYLRVVRQRQVFDICAATFGKDYFFTLREAEIKPQVTFATLLIFLLALWMLFWLCFSWFGFFTGIINFAVLVVLGFFLMWNALRMGLTRLDNLLLKLPAIGPVYETWFRRSTTYFQHDTRVVFLKLMDDLLKQQVDEETSAKGIKLLSCFEHQPIFDGFYKITERKTGQEPQQ